MFKIDNSDLYEFDPHFDRYPVPNAVANAFAVLRGEGWFAKANHTCCQSCGWSEVPEDAESVVFYHDQDAESMAETGELYLAFQGNGNRIVEALHHAGLQATWNGSLDHRIKVTFD